LAAPRPGELFLVYFQRSGRAWVGFAIEPSGVAARDLDAAALSGAARTPEALSRALLAPFHAEIDRAKSVRFFAPRALAAVDFHALPYGRGPLIDRVPVTYGLDVRTEHSSAESDPGATPAALIVADPLGTLPEAHTEGEIVDRSLRASGMRVTLLTAQSGAG